MQEIQVNLKPAFLGMVKIVVEKIDQEVKIILYVDRPEVRNAIEGQINQISKSLQDQNIRIERIDVQDFSSYASFKDGANPPGQDEKQSLFENDANKKTGLNKNTINSEDLDNNIHQRDFGYNTIELIA